MDVKTLAVQLEITFHGVPAGGIDQFQPLDLLIFVTLKSMSRWLFMQGFALVRMTRGNFEEA
jgi:hypothetical protein